MNPPNPHNPANRQVMISANLDLPPWILIFMAVLITVSVVASGILL